MQLIKKFTFILYTTNELQQVTLSDTEITSLVNFIEYWNDVQQADQDLLDNIARKLDQTIKHRENYQGTK